MSRYLLFIGIASIALGIRAEAHAQPTTIIVSPGESIQAGIELANDGDQVWVEAGTYSETIDFLGKAITVVAADGSSDTIIDAGGVGSVVRFVTGEGDQSVLQGFILRGGGGDDVGGITEGGGVRIVDSSPRIVNCEIRENSASDGGGIHVRGLASSPLFHLCDVHSNEADFTGGGACLEDAYEPEFVNCSFVSNEALSGAGLWIHFGSPTLRDCSMVDNQAALTGGAGTVVSGALFLNQSEIKLNEAQNGGGFLLDDSSVLVQRSRFQSNSAQAQGGAFRLQGETDLTLHHCTLGYNTAIQAGSGIYVGEAESLVIYNSIVHGELGEQLAPTDLLNAIANVSWTAVDGDLGLPYHGDGNINQDPNLEDGELGDLLLAELSPCIDMGDPSSLPDPDGTIADMGAVYRETVENRFIRGDCNSDGSFNVGDAVFGLVSLFPSPGDVPPTCDDACDVNDDSLFNVADVIFGLNALFAGGAPTPTAPFPSCDFDPSDDDPFTCDQGAC